MEFNLKLDLLANPRGKSPCFPLLPKGEGRNAARCIILLFVLTSLFWAPASAGAQVPSLPQYYYGALKINGAPAPVGTIVEARAPGILTGPYNPIVTTQAGKYGDASPAATVPRLLVQGNILDGAAIEFFVNGIKANQTGLWRSGQISLLDLTAANASGVVTAEIGLSQGHDSMAYVAVRIARFFDSVNSGTMTLPEGIGAYDTHISYDAAGMTAKSAAGVAPFPSPTVNLNTLSGTRTTIASSQTGFNPNPPLELVKVYPWLTGGRDNVYTITLHFNSVTLTGGNAVPTQGDVVKSFRRGDANNSGLVTITDALFIAQYLAGLRGLGEGPGQIWAVNAASARNDYAAGASISIADALYIAQMLVGLRDSSFNQL